MFRSCLVLAAIAAVVVSAGDTCIDSSVPDLCEDPFTLNDSDGNFLRKVCYIKESQNWTTAMEFCDSIGYSLLRIDSEDVEKSFLDYLDSVGTDWDQGFWINGKAQDDETWQLVDPNEPYPYMTITAVPGSCLGYHYKRNQDFNYNSFNCESDGSFFCERNEC